MNQVVSSWTSIIKIYFPKKKKKKKKDLTHLGNCYSDELQPYAAESPPTLPQTSSLDHLSYQNIQEVYFSSQYMAVIPSNLSNRIQKYYVPVINFSSTIPRVIT